MSCTLGAVSHGHVRLREKAPDMASRKESGPNDSNSMHLPSIIANVLTLCVLIWICFLGATDQIAYEQLVQEDQFVEWTTYAVFLAAAVFHWMECLRRHNDSRAFWFLTAVGLFCLVVAGEEISWGQRMLGFEAPEYFLENNFQKELNLHNMMGRDWQAILLVLLILGYGMLLPLLADAEPGAKLAKRLGIVPPPLELMPAFFAAFVLYLVDPWDRIDEVAELMWGLCFMFAAPLRMLSARRLPRALRGRFQQPAIILLLFIAAFGSGLSLARNSSAREIDPTIIESFELRRTRWEIEKLGRDFQHVVRQAGKIVGRTPKMHKRVSAFARDYDVDRLYFGKFSIAAVGEDGDKHRSSFFLDPWDRPYWMHLTMQGKTTIASIYSLGPNGKRESQGHRPGGDDILITVKNR